MITSSGRKTKYFIRPEFESLAPPALKQVDDDKTTWRTGCTRAAVNARRPARAPTTHFDGAHHLRDEEPDGPGSTPPGHLRAERHITTGRARRRENARARKWPTTRGARRPAARRARARARVRCVREFLLLSVLLATDSADTRR